MPKLKYDASFPGRAREYAAAGMNDSAIARQLEIGSETFYAYKRQFPEFAEALERGRRLCYGRMRKQLLSMALGECAVITETSRDGDLYKTTLRQLPPNLPAIKYWLAQRDSKLSGTEVCGTVSPLCPFSPPMRDVSDRRLSRMSRKERQRLLKNRMETRGGK